MKMTKSLLAFFLVLAVFSACTPLVGQTTRQTQKTKTLVTAPPLQLLPDLKVDKLEFFPHKVKVWIKNAGLTNAPGPHIKAKISMIWPPNGWTEEKSIINRVGQPGAVVPTKKPSDRAHVTFDLTGKVFEAPYICKFTILVDSTFKVKEKDEKNNTRVHDGTIK